MAFIKGCRLISVEDKDGTSFVRFFSNMEKENQSKNCITELEDEKGKKVCDLVGILDTVESFYRTLFKKEGVHMESVEKVLRTVSARLSDIDRTSCDSDISVLEINEAISSLNTNKSPGLDGLTGEFYKAFKDVLALVLLELYHYMEDKQVMPKTMAAGVLTILFKNKGSRLRLENYRPISFLNTDYKILAKILANRLKNVIGSIVAPTQAYSIPG